MTVDTCRPPRYRLTLLVLILLAPAINLLLSRGAIDGIPGIASSKPTAISVQQQKTVSITTTWNGTTTYRRASGGVESIKQPPPCQVLIRNHPHFHLEVLESVAKLFPLRHIQLPPPEQCDPKVLIFNYLLTGGKDAYTNKRFDVFQQYFQSNLLNSSVIDTDPRDDVSVERRIGSLQLVGNNFKRFLTMANEFESSYHAVIETSCYCHEKVKGFNATQWLLGGEHRSCIFHERCDGFRHFSRAVWVSPHFEQYFLPTALPQPVAASKNISSTKNETVYDICSVGALSRRNWELLSTFLQSCEARQILTKITVRFRLFGKGDMPELLIPFKDSVTILIERHDNDIRFAMEVKSCDVLILLVTKQANKDYFLTPLNSMYKLSGTIPQIIAYNKSFVIPDELMDMYQPHLPTHVPHASYDDSDHKSFIVALSTVIAGVAYTETCNISTSCWNVNPEGLPSNSEESIIHE